jgi:S-(hydroxymethyl)glutathione dehydrogenase/alcohol dehydrogenase
MRAAMLVEVGAPLAVEEVTLLPPGPDDVIVRTGAAAFCSTDCISHRGDLVKTLPTILGHAAIGVVEEIGARVDGVRAGDRVVVPGTPECGTCFYCARGRPDQCSELFDIADFRHVADRASGEAVTAAGNIGGYAERMRLSKNHVFPVASDLPDDQLCLLGCGITSGMGTVLNIAEVQAGSSVVVVGCGHLGLWMIQGARVAGAGQIVAVDPDPARRAVAGELGATDLVDPADGDPVEQVRALTGGRGADYGLDAAGPARAQEEAFAMTRRAGVVVLTGVERMDATVTLPQVPFALQGKTVHSCQNGRVRMRRDLPRFVRMIEDGRVDPKPIITRRYALDEINDALQASATRQDLTGVIEPGR